MTDPIFLCDQCGEDDWGYVYSFFERGRTNLIKKVLYLVLEEEIPLETETFFQFTCGFCGKEVLVDEVLENLGIGSHKGEKNLDKNRYLHRYYCPKCNLKRTKDARLWEYIRRQTVRGEALIVKEGGKKRAALLEPEETELVEHIRCLRCGYMRSTLGD